MQGLNCMFRNQKEDFQTYLRKDLNVRTYAFGKQKRGPSHIL